MADLESRIEEAASGPAKATGDQGSIEEQDLGDLIEADRYLASKAATRSTQGIGIRFAKLSPPGTV